MYSPPSSFQTVVVPISLAVVVLFGIWAIVLSRNITKTSILSTEFFLTAKNTQSTSRVAWGFYATSVGASVMFSTASLITDPLYGIGIIGLFTYAFYSGLPILLVAHLGSLIQRKYPSVMSITSYARLRYGPTYEILLSLLVLFNMSVAMVAEFTAVGDLFETILGVPRIIPVLVVGFVTMVYTGIGGLYVSILTDQIQSIFSLLLLGIVGVYVAITFRPTLGPLPDYLGPSDLGYASLFSLGVSLPSSALFSDALWQRVWSAQDEKSLKTGALIGSLVTFMVCFIFGLAGFMSSWAGLSFDSETSFFAILRPTSILTEGDTTASTPLWIMILVCVIAVTMNESAIDSFQNALLDTIGSVCQSHGRPLSLFSLRVLLLGLNVVLMYLGSLGLKIAGLYLVTNILCASFILPFLMGLMPMFDWIKGPHVILGSLGGILSVIIHGLVVDGTNGIINDFYIVYDWPPFLVALLSSVVLSLLSAGLSRAFFSRL